MDKTKLKHNIWEDASTLGRVLKVLKTIREKGQAQNITESLRGEDGAWWWVRNSQCKYINLRLDMRTGDFTLMNRDNKRISIEELEYQYKDGDESE